MKVLLTVLFLSISSLIALISVLASSPRKIILGWLSLGLLQSFFFLVIGFELIALLNIFLVVGSATVLKLFSSLYGSEEIRRIESEMTTRNWIYGLGQTLTVGVVLGFAFSEVPFVDRFKEELEIKLFANGMVERFPEITWILGFILFLILVVAGTVGRPAWKKVQKGQK